MRRHFPWILIYAGLIALGVLISQQVPSLIGMKEQIAGAMPGPLVVTGILIAFMLTSAIPFVPGAEIGLGLIVAFGAKVALPVYLCMIVALMLTYSLGRVVPPLWLAARLRGMRLKRAAILVEEIALLPPEDCANYLARHSTRPLVRQLLSYRYVALAVALNVPGNTLLGGGGGLALFAGMSRLFTPWAFLITLVVAVAPIPLTIFMMGYQP